MFAICQAQSTCNATKIGISLFYFGCSTMKGNTLREEILSLQFWRSFRFFVADIKIAHSIFALPFALSSLTFLNNYQLSFPTFLKLVVCMVMARSFAMGINRYLDRNIDRENPRTASRSIPSGRLSPQLGLFWSLAFGAGFIITAATLSPTAGWLAAPLLLILAFYSMMKRISWLTHWYLGLCLGLSPIAVSVALVGSCSLPVIFLGAAVMFWTAGFDILYSLQDESFDTRKGLYSVPASLGRIRSLRLSRLSFLTMTFFLTVAGYLGDRGGFYYSGVALIALTLVYEQWLLRHAAEGRGLEKINFAFFQLNGVVSLLFGFFAVLDALA